MFKQAISFDVWGGDAGKYRLRDKDNNPLENTPEETCERVSRSLADLEPGDEATKEQYFKLFMSIMGKKFAGGGRIMANAGAGLHKKETSPINCTVMRQIPDSMDGIMTVAKEAAITLKSGCGVGYDFSTIRPKGSFVFGAGAQTSGVISFMKIFDSVCSTVMSGGGRRGAQMACLDVSSPEIEDFITAKRQDGMLRYFNCSVLVTDAFMEAVEADADWELWFWEKIINEDEISNVNEKDVCLIIEQDIPYNHRNFNFFKFAQNHTEVEFGNCTVDDIYKKRVYKTVKAKYIFDLVMRSTYEFWEPGFIFIDRANIENNLYFCEKIRATNPCSEQFLQFNGACLLGSMILTTYIASPFDSPSFNFAQFIKDVRIANRLLDNVVEVNNLPLPELREQILSKRRHGLGFTGVGSSLNMMNIPYGSPEGIAWLEEVSFVMARESLYENISLAKEKGPAPIFSTKKNRQAVLKSVYLTRLINALPDKDQVIKDILEFGLRYSHATSIAPTGTLSLTWGNNCSNGIEPVFSNSYLRNIREAGKKTKTQEEVMDYAYFLWKEKYGDKELPSTWRTTNDLSVNDHIQMQAVAQKWNDSAISKTINVPADYPFEDFKNIYMQGWKLGLKGMTTYRPNATIGAGVLATKSDLEKVEYVFTCEDGSEVVLKGTDSVEYDGEVHNAANLFDALKEGIYGNM